MSNPTRQLVHKHQNCVGSYVILAVASFILGGISPVLAEPTAPAAESTDSRLMHFYLSPSRAEFDSIQRGIGADLSKFESKSNGADIISAVFLARVHEKYQWPLIDLGQLDDRAKSIVDRDSTQLAAYVNDDSRVDPGKLDIWWSSFFATGDTKNLDKIAAQVGDLERQSGVAKLLLMGAANWSYTANCRQHPAVLRHAKSLLARNPPIANRESILDAVARAEAPVDPNQGSPQWRQTGKEFPDEPWRKSVKGFGALEVELDDPLGEYRIQAVVRDKVAGVQVPLVQVLKVLPAE